MSTHLTQKTFHHSFVYSYTKAQKAMYEIEVALHFIAKHRIPLAEKNSTLYRALLTATIILEREQRAISELLSEALEETAP